ncbi:MAG: hypothetical protein ACFB15_25780 [Cyclobacteriaceae bacterium]|mgnify:CR=1 FL=1
MDTFDLETIRGARLLEQERQEILAQERERIKLARNGWEESFPETVNTREGELTMGEHAFELYKKGEVIARIRLKK